MKALAVAVAVLALSACNVPPPTGPARPSTTPTSTPATVPGSHFRVGRATVDTACNNGNRVYVTYYDVYGGGIGISVAAVPDDPTCTLVME